VDKPQFFTGLLLQRSVSIGLVITELLFLLELGFPASAPRAVAMPGWIALMFRCGFDGCPGEKIVPWVLFGTANFVVYTVLAFFMLILAGVIRAHPRKSAAKGI
jgi:hypothetical protein